MNDRQHLLGQLLALTSVESFLESCRDGLVVQEGEDDAKNRAVNASPEVATLIAKREEVVAHAERLRLQIKGCTLTAKSIDEEIAALYSKDAE